MNRHRTFAFGTLLVSLGLALLGACSSSHKIATSTTTAPAASTPASSTPASSTTVASSSAPSSAAASTSELSGSWSGTYSGAYQGTFNLSWTQSGSTLSGTIEVSGLGGSPTHVSGTLHGSSIQFGTVGSQSITYTGSVSGSSMSGTYQVHSPAGSAGGSWSASKTS
jgi:glucan 1,3-beta-glucosidase